MGMTKGKLPLTKNSGIKNGKGCGAENLGRGHAGGNKKCKTPIGAAKAENPKIPK